MNELSLYHHGVKGQKWGVRRVRKKLDRALGYRRGRTSSNNDLKRLRSDVDKITNLRKEQWYGDSRANRKLAKSKLKDHYTKMHADKGRQYVQLALKTSLKESTVQNLQRTAGALVFGPIGGAIGAGVGSITFRNKLKQPYDSEGNKIKKKK